MSLTVGLEQLEQTARDAVDTFIQEKDLKQNTGVWQEIVGAVERAIIERMLAATGSQSGAAVASGINRATMRDRMARFDIPLPEKK